MNRSTDAVTFLSLGPGDSELLTLKAVRLLREADVVMIPATQGSDGKVSSRAQTIIAEWVAEEQMHLYPLPMSKNREAALQTYDTMVNDAAALFREGRRVVIAVEGDVSIYASIHYVLCQLQADGIPVAQVPGIPSFIAAAAMADLSLVSQQQRLVVLPGDADVATLLPGDADVATLQQLLDSQHVVVVMKLSQCADAVKEFLRQHSNTECHYFENVGTTEAYHTSVSDEILSRSIPYFSLCILFPA